MPLFLLLGALRPDKIKLFTCAASLGSRFAGLFLQPLAGDADALLLVRIGRTQRAHVGGHLADLAFVRAADHDVRLLFHRDLNAFRNRKLDRDAICQARKPRFCP